MFDGLIGRIPIYNRRLNVFGYDLRFCSPSAVRDGVLDDPATVGKLIIQASHEFSLTQITGDVKAFISMPPALLSDCDKISWPKDRLVLTILGEALADKTLEQRLKQLAAEGYAMAVRNPPHPSELMPNAGFVSILQVDAQSAEQLEVDTSLPAMHTHGTRVLVSDVDTPAQYQRFFELGFDYYQGCYFEQPKPVQASEIPANRLAILDLLARLHNPETNSHQVEEMVRGDITLSYKLLRLINSAYFGLPNRIESIRRAVIFFGLHRLKNWATVVLVNAVDYKPRELLTTAMIRARTCELLAQALGRDRVERYYIAGLFSLLNAIMDVPMETILKHLSLVSEINEALTIGSGPVGEVLACVLAFEKGACHQAPCHDFPLGVPMKAYLDAIAWATAAAQELRV
jgi:EAL and modified HD-GYP domain-containing signal transduction protein